MVDEQHKIVSVVMAKGKRPAPFRTRKLSLSAPMVLHAEACGRVGHRRTHHCVWPRNLTVAGLTPADAEARVALQYKNKNFLQDPQVSIFVKEFTTQRITLDGALLKPGIYPLTGQITLLRALALGGGSGPMADMENVMLFRLMPDGRSVMEKFDVDKIRRGEAPDPPLQGDDVVVVNRDSKRTAVRDSLFRDIIDTINPFAARIP